MATTNPVAHLSSPVWPTRSARAEIDKDGRLFLEQAGGLLVLTPSQVHQLKDFINEHGVRHTDECRYLYDRWECPPTCVGLLEVLLVDGQGSDE